MKNVDISTARSTLPELVREVAETGTSVSLTRYGKSTGVVLTNAPEFQADPNVAGSPEIRPRQESEPIRAYKPGNWSSRNTGQAERDRILGNMKKR